MSRSSRRRGYVSTGGRGATEKGCLSGAREETADILRTVLGLRCEYAGGDVYVSGKVLMAGRFEIVSGNTVV